MSVWDKDTTRVHAFRKLDVLVQMGIEVAGVAIEVEYCVDCYLFRAKCDYTGDELAAMPPPGQTPSVRYGDVMGREIRQWLGHVSDHAKILRERAGRLN